MLEYSRLRGVFLHSKFVPWVSIIIQIPQFLLLF